MLNLISLVGLDAQTDASRITSLYQVIELFNRQYGTDLKLEFGYLYSQSRAGNDQRYPDHKVMSRLRHQLHMQAYGKTHRAGYSIHLCGREAIDDFLEQKPAIAYMCEGADRVQLNLNVNNYDIGDLAQQIIDLTRDYTLILQVNRSKQELIETVLKLNVINPYAEKIHLLHDASGGLGRAITTVEPASSINFTGYAGGLNPTNVVSIMEAIDNVTPKDVPYYLDMESGIRTDDWLNIDKCVKVIYNLLTAISTQQESQS